MDSSSRANPLFRLAPILGVVLFAAALWVLHRELHGLAWRDVRAQLDAITHLDLALALGCTAASYGALVGYDVLALRYLGIDLSLRRTTLAGLVSWAVTNTVGHGWLSGGTVRLRMYGAWGITPGEVTRVVAMSTLTFWAGLLVLAGGALLVEPPAAVGGWGRLFGVLALGVVVATGAIGALRREPLRVAGWEFTLPGPGTVATQVAVGLVDQVAAAGALYLLLPRDMALSFPQFVALYAVALTGGVLSGIPGAAGTFDGILVKLAAGAVSPAAVLGALIAWRLVYYVVPLAVAALALAGWEAANARSRVGEIGGLAGRLAGAITPPLLSTLTFLAGVLLVLTGVRPAIPDRMAVLAWAVPLPLVETSHLAAGLSGVALLFVARALRLRIREAWAFAIGLLLVGAIASMGRGLEWEQAVFLLGVLVVAIAGYRRFDRHSRLSAGAVTPSWLGAVLLVMLAASVVLLIAFRDVAYQSSLWTRFGIAQDAPRALRTIAVSASAAAVGGAWVLLRPARLLVRSATAEDLERALPVVRASPSTHAWLSLLGDKALLFSHDHDAFLMFGTSGRTWVAFGDPVGPVERWPDLAWKFRELADRHAARIAFYEVSPASLPLYLDLGLGAFKLGEEAVVSLSDFTLQGREAKGFRHTLNVMEKEGVTFEIVEPGGVEAILGDLRAVSDGWLHGKSGGEKGFSIGFFSPEYLRRTPIGVVRAGGRIVAFANVLDGGGRELSVDLMRHLDDAPSGTMDFLFVSLMSWGKERGFERFTLGMAPLSGLPDRDLAPLWTRFGTLVFRHGEAFYNFQGLRQYKEKFHPTWEPRYLACTGGLVLPAVLAGVTALVSRSRVASPVPRSMSISASTPK